VPPLRDRREDVAELAHHFLFRYARESNRDLRGISPEALDMLQRSDWPGNVRQLQNCIQSAVYQTAGRMLHPADFPGLTASPPVEGPSSGFDLIGTIEAMLKSGATDLHARIIALVERELLARALRHTQGHQAQASELLGINRTTLRSKLRELGIEVNRVVADRGETADE
jgi:two-component system nitrogen regulation response regulator GlnG